VNFDPASVPVWQRRPDARRLACADAAQLQRLRQILQAAELAWRSAWGVAAGDETVRCELLLRDAQVDDGELLGQKPGAVAQVRWNERAHHPLYQREAGRAPLAAAANAACRDDRAARLASALGLDRPGAPMAVAAVPAGRWSGSVRVVLACGSELRLDAATVARLAPRVRGGAAVALPALVPAPQAAAGRRLHLQALLADCTLTLGRLQDLQPGDVVRLDHRLDAPLRLHAADAVVFTGFLAARRGRKVLELAAPSPNPPVEKTTP